MMVRLVVGELVRMMVGELLRMMFRLATWMQITGSGVVLKT